ncbi:MAG: hypothetical protein VR69_00395 [Peptococcaceae bacterium BRH_c4b]|nr:MAG: hypothetical protein VR69_00395 [Peptococcaceae bacterium BRH_c4b]
MFCFLLGLFCLAVYPAGGDISENDNNNKEYIELSTEDKALGFPKATIGQISEEQRITTIVQGNDRYQLYIQATSLVTDDSKELPPSVIEFKEESEQFWLHASDALIPVLSTPAKAKNKGDQKRIAIRLNIPESAVPGLYTGEMTVIASVCQFPQEIESPESAESIPE